MRLAGVSPRAGAGGGAGSRSGSRRWGCWQRGPSEDPARTQRGSPQDAPRGLGAGALLRAHLVPLAQVLARRLLHGVLGEWPQAGPGGSGRTHSLVRPHEEPGVGGWGLGSVQTCLPQGADRSAQLGSRPTLLGNQEILAARAQPEFQPPGGEP